jgi:hypothetical protein
MAVGDGLELETVLPLGEGDTEQPETNSTSAESTSGLA